ncbi:hypothetical protein HGRIS_002351 [Hohenbuehelia grisea]|uniref:Aminoglycoside phosphotransferase domain-containing protein n=1 Tax=Hohenbuehelia grisea TaxID=104357 RepID=A0ABR3JK96_9AGAR
MRDFISVRTSEIRDWSARRWPGVKFIPGLCDKLHEASEKLLKDVTFSERNALFHRDFAARNLIVHREAPDAQWKITGVLDWDDADVGPLELASIWPDWLWTPEDQPSSEFYLFERDPDKPVHDDNCGRIRAAFIAEMERLDAGYVDRVRLTRDTKLQTLY